jgi:hypothetical protein
MTNEDTIRLASYEEWIEHEREHRESVEKRNPESIALMLSVVEKKESTRRSLMERFPYSAVLEGTNRIDDFASRWLWANVSPCDGKCHDYYSEYPACPVVLATKTLRDYQYTTKDGRVVKGKAPEYQRSGGTLPRRQLGRDVSDQEWLLTASTSSISFNPNRTVNGLSPLFRPSEMAIISKTKRATKMATTIETFQSKWGFHPVSLETSRKLRKLNAAYDKAARRAKSWERWDRKAPHNRVQKSLASETPRVR